MIGKRQDTGTRSLDQTSTHLKTTNNIISGLELTCSSESLTRADTSEQASERLYNFRSAPTIWTWLSAILNAST